MTPTKSIVLLHMGVCVYNSKVFFVMIFLRLSVWVCLGKKNINIKFLLRIKIIIKKKQTHLRLMTVEDGCRLGCLFDVF